MRRSRAVLERFVDPVTARGVDALIEGLVMHMTLSTATFQPRGHPHDRRPHRSPADPLSGADQ